MPGNTGRLDSRRHSRFSRSSSFTERPRREAQTVCLSSRKVAGLVMGRNLPRLQVADKGTGRDTMRSASMVSMLTALALVPSMKVAAQEHAARPEEIDPNTSRLFFAPTGRTLPAGTAELGDVWLFFPSIGVGMTDRVSVAAGVS